jgi:hypothetical protein
MEGKTEKKKILNDKKLQFLGLYRYRKKKHEKKNCMA